MSSSKNLEYAKTAFLSKSNSAFIEEMYLKFVNNDPDLPNGWREYFSDIGEEFEVVVNEINGPSWSPSKKVSINRNQIQSNEDKKINPIDSIRSNANSIKACLLYTSDAADE